MKKSIACIILAVALCGCSAITKGLTDQAAFVQATLNANLPDNFTGPAQLHLHGTYVTIDVWGAGLAKDKTTDKWTWTYCKFDAVGKYPLFYGVNLSNEIHLLEGEPVILSSMGVSPVATRFVPISADPAQVEKMRRTYLRQPAKKVETGPDGVTPAP